MKNTIKKVTFKDEHGNLEPREFIKKDYFWARYILKIALSLWMTLAVIHFTYWVVTDKNIIDFLMTQ